MTCPVWVNMQYYEHISPQGTGRQTARNEQQGPKSVVITYLQLETIVYYTFIVSGELCLCTSPHQTLNNSGNNNRMIAKHMYF